MSVTMEILTSGIDRAAMCPQPHHAVDKQIAAIALVHDLTVVTRNVADFKPTGVRLQNPFV